MIERINGLWWPEGERDGRYVIVRDVEEAVKAVLAVVPGRDCIVQAGGNVGVYADALAHHFRLVVTAEPDPVNVACMILNLAAAAAQNVEEFYAAFGAAEGRCRTVEVSPNNCGAHRIEAGGRTPVITIDGLGLTACDCIWLDVEGSELLALKGAAETIDRFRPVVIAEEKGLGAVYGVGPNDIATWLAQRDYEPAGRVGNDRIYLRRTP